jgi:hypothetical protein
LKKELSRIPAAADIFSGKAISAVQERNNKRLSGIASFRQDLRKVSEKRTGHHSASSFSNGKSKLKLLYNRS